MGHRVGSLALLLLVGAVGARLAHKAHRPLLLFAFGCADLALLGGFIALVLGRREGRPSREALGLVIFTAAVLATTVALLLLAAFGPPS